MKILITGDLHIPFHLKNDLFFDIAENYLSHIYNNEEYDYFIDNGDTADKADKVISYHFKHFYQLYQNLNKKGNVIKLLGNHDIINNSNDSVFKTWDKAINVVNHYDKIEFNNTIIHLLSYTKDIQDILNIVIDENKYNLLITHLDINNFYLNEKMKSNDGFDKQVFDKFDLVISGHYHYQQKQNNILYIGSPYQHNFGEIDKQCYYCIFDTEKQDYSLIEYKDFPHFKDIYIDDVLNKNNNFNNNFIRLKIDKKIDNLISIKHYLYDKGVLDIKLDINIDESETLDKINIDENETLDNIIKKFIIEKNKIKNEFDENDLIKTFRKIIC